MTVIYKIMTPAQFDVLSRFSDFRSINGQNYQQHILFVVDFLTVDQKQNIICTKDAETALELLKSYGILYKHFDTIEVDIRRNNR
jgi:hypothetical protein